MTSKYLLHTRHSGRSSESCVWLAVTNATLKIHIQGYKALMKQHLPWKGRGEVKAQESRVTLEPGLEEAEVQEKTGELGRGEGPEDRPGGVEVSLCSVVVIMNRDGW